MLYVCVTSPRRLRTDRRGEDSSPVRVIHTVRVKPQNAVVPVFPGLVQNMVQFVRARRTYKMVPTVQRVLLGLLEGICTERIVTYWMDPTWHNRSHTIFYTQRDE